MPLLVPFTSSPADTFTCLLGDGNKYVFESRYNDRGSYWTFDLTRDVDQVKLVSAVTILLGQDLLDPYILGIGSLVAIDESDADIEAGADDLGVRVNVYWFPAAELAAAASGVTA